MPVNTNFQIPFIPQEGITSQILAAIQAANEQHRFQQQLQIQQQQANIAQQRANIEQQESPARIQEMAERAGLFGEEARQKRTQTDQMLTNISTFNDVVPPTDQTATPGAWIPNGTPKAHAQMVSGMLQGLNPQGQERNILQAASDAGKLKATKLGGTTFDYAEELRNGIDKVTTARSAVAKLPGEQQISQRDAESINAGLVAQFRGQFPNQEVPPSMLVRAGDTKDHVNNVKGIYENLEKQAQTRSQNALAAATQQGNLALRQILVGQQQQKFEGEPVIAYDRQSKELKQSTRGEVAQSGGQLTNPAGTTEAQLTKHRDTLGQLNEAQLNLSRAQQAYNLIPGGELSLSDKRAVAAIEGDDKFHAEFGFGKQGVQLPVDWANRLINNENFQSLSPAAKAAVIGDLRLQGPAVLAYTKALTNTGRMNEVALRAESRTMPNAGMDESTRNQLLLSFQQNIDQLSKSTPRMVGMDKPEDVKGRIDSEPVGVLPVGGATPPKIPQVGAGGTLQELQRRLFGGGGTPVPQATPPAEQSFGESLRAIMGNQ